MIDRRLMRTEAATLRAEINGISRRIGKGKVSDADVRAVESRAALASLFEETANSEEALRQTFAEHGGNAAASNGGPWSSFGDYLLAVHRAADPRLTTGPDPRLETRSASGLGESVPADGGFLVPNQFSPALMRLIGYQSELAPRCLNVPVTIGNEIKFPGIDEQSRANGSRWGGISSTWLSEGVAITASKAKFRAVNLTLGRLTSAVYATDELLSDAGVLGAFMGAALPAEVGFRMDESILRGPGGGEGPLGILNSNALITVSKESGQAAGSINQQNVIKMFGRMLPECRKNAVWFVSPELEEQLYTLPLSVGTGGGAVNLFTPADDAAMYGRLMNRTIVPIEQASTIGTVGDIVFADFSRYVIADRPIDLAISMHVRFVWDESLYRCVYRVDGASALHTPITSYNGGAQTCSAFVTLETRA